GLLHTPACKPEALQLLPQNTPAMPPQSESLAQDFPAFGPLVQIWFDSKHASAPLPVGGGGSTRLQLPVVSSGLLHMPPVPQSPVVLHCLSMVVATAHQHTPR